MQPSPVGESLYFIERSRYENHQLRSNEARSHIRENRTLPPEEVANVWRLWKAGIVWENYARADELGVVIVFELDSVEAAKRYTDDFPLTKAGFLEWFFIPVQVPLPIEVLFNSNVDTRKPYDRTRTGAQKAR
jgi:hypothetical protein